MTRVLVTGATGFIGRHLVGYLSESGLEVTCLTRRSLNMSGSESPTRQRLVYGDVRYPESLNLAVQNQHLVIHLAGLTRSVSKSDLDSINGTGTHNLVQSCLRQKSPPVLVLVSSLAAAGPGTGYEMRTETDLESPVSNYGRSKRLGEQFALKAGATRMPISIVRPPVVFGEGDRDCLNLFRGIANTGWHFVPTTKDHLFSLIHVSDLCRALKRIATQGRRCRSEDDRSGIYYVSADEHPSYAQLGQMIGRTVGRTSVRIMYCPNWLVRATGAAGQTMGWLRQRPTLLNLDKAREAVAGSWTCSNRKLCEETGFRLAAPLQIRLRQTAEWYFANGLVRPRVRRPQPVGSGGSVVAKSRENLFGTSRRVNQ